MMTERLKQFIDSLDISVRAFEQTIGASNGLIRKAITNNSDIQSKWLSTIVDNYPQINSDWLLTGKGEMIKELKSQLIPVEYTHEGIPLIPVSAMAGVFTGEIQILEEECERYVVPAFKGANFLITVKGNSMSPTYDSGDMVACKVLTTDDFFFQWNKVYVIDTNQGILIKRIKPGDSKNHVEIVSDNPSYPPFQLSLKAIYHVALVVGVIRLE